MEQKIQNYLDEEMSIVERNAFEQQIASDPILKMEVEERAYILDRIKTQMLREKITAIIADDGGDNPPLQNTFGRLVWLFIPLLLVLSAVAWHFRKEEPPTPDIPMTQWPVEPNPPIEEKEVPIIPEPPLNEATKEKKPEVKAPPKKRAIAENPVDVIPSNSSGVRGEDIQNEEWDQLVESVWVTRFEPRPGEFNERFAPVADLLKEKNTTDAFVQLYLLERESPENDTLSFLKGICLLEMREGAQALDYFNKVKIKNNWSQNIDWYKSLSYLINSEKVKAIREAELIAKNKNHLFYKEAEKLLEVFQ